ncbi:helix-turn-helix domain-containing protein [Planococcus halocryophilus]|uniref:helix-turn-helix domain-containing protein n=1 Tax=Planococcus halocryophilus TaxID=1215089 RepID=UPI001F0DA09B|nr:helix-turn-helix transcriptional regulator [Planococcus halocryophilus]MCH4825554.1 helix-turn-helix domain-containing protein [Planococcus halocryophilus]
MNNLSFGKELKYLRKQAGIPSKVLSKKVGKAVTYVSQLERELIKNPSYDTCIKILLELGLDITEAEKMLSYFDIKSKEAKEAEYKSTLMQDRENSWQANSDYYVKKFEQIEKSKSLFLQLADKRFSTLGQYDNSKANKVLDNLNKILNSEEKSDFFFSLFENDFSKLNLTETELILRKIDKDYKQIVTKKIIEEMDGIE